MISDSISHLHHIAYSKKRMTEERLLNHIAVIRSLSICIAHAHVPNRTFGYTAGGNVLQTSID